MAGDQSVFQYVNRDSYEVFRNIILDRLNIFLDRYEYQTSGINHVIVTFIPVNNNLMNKFKVIDLDPIVSPLVKDNFAINTFIPVTVTSQFLALELSKYTDLGKIVDVQFNNLSRRDNRLISLA